MPLKRRPKGLPKTGGRQKGTPNKATAKREKEIASSGLTPLDYMLGLLRDDTLDRTERLEAAKAAAPYVHPKLATLQTRTEITGRLTLEQLVAQSTQLPDPDDI